MPAHRRAVSRIAFMAFGLAATSLTACFASPATAQEQNPLVQSGSIGVKKKEPGKEAAGDYPFHPIEKWVGERFVFLPKEKQFRWNYGVSLKGSPPLTRTPYNELVGKVAKVISVTPEKDAVSAGQYDVELQVEETGKVYVTHALSNMVMDIGPVADIELARKKLIGKALWYRYTSLATYDGDKQETVWATIPKFSKVYVTNVVAGTYNFDPVRLIFKTTTGQEGYIDVCLSGTNSNGERGGYIGGVRREFMEVNPRKIYLCSDKVWAAIEQEKMLIGMTSEEAQLSWGRPDKVNTTRTERGNEEQWVYEKKGAPSRFLYIANDKVRTVQD